MQVKRSYNPLILDHDCQVLDVKDGLTPNEIIIRENLTFTRPFVLLVNGEPWLREKWDSIVPVASTCHFLELPRGGGNSNPLRIVAMVAIMVAAMVVPGLIGLTGGWAVLGSAIIAIGGSLLVNALFPAEMASTAKSQEKADTIYVLSTSSNQLRIGEPFAEHFGRFICYPDLAQGSYTRIINNDQYLYFLGIIGVGEYDVEGVYINKTLMSDYADVDYNILNPGTSPSLVPNIVWTAAEISGQELTTEYLTSAVTAAGAKVYYIEFDILFPSGLLRYNDKGRQRNMSAGVVAHARLIDEAGTAIGSWRTIHSKTYTAASPDPLRYSIKCPAPSGLGRYEFRIKRTEDASTSGQEMDTVTCGGLRGDGGSHPDYGDITMIEARIKATDQLNGDVANKINVVATRKLYAVGSTALGTTLTASRSIVDACAYIVTADNGGQQDDSILNFDTLAALRANHENAGYFFDWRFTARTSIMDACKKAAKCGRSVPYMPGGLFDIVQDEVKALPSQVYTDNDFDKDSLVLNHIMRTEDSPTCVEVHYINPDTWQEESVTCLDINGSETNPSVIQLDGCTSRQHAYEIGMYLYLDDYLNRVQVEFSTGLKGHIPQLGEKLLVAASMVDWGQTGMIKAVNGSNIWLSEPVDFKGETAGQMYVTTEGGGVGGPYAVAPTTYAHCVQGAIPGLLNEADNGLEAANYLFGPESAEFLAVRCVSIRPQGMNQIAIAGTIVDDAVYVNPGTAPVMGSSTGIPALLAALSLNYTGEDSGSYEFYLTWIGSAGEVLIELDEGSGYATLQDNYSDHGLAFSTTATSLTVQVTPYEDSVLQTGDALTETYEIIQPPTGLALVGTPGQTVSIDWDDVTGAEGYEVSLWVDGVEQGGETVTESEAVTTVEEMAEMGGPWPSFVVHVSTIKDAKQSEEDATLQIDIDPMTAPTNLVLQTLLSSGATLSWDTVTDATGYKVYQGDTPAFDPETEGTLVYSGSSAVGTVAGLDLTSPYTYYFKVAATNSYYHAVDDLVFSSVLTVTG